MNQRRTHRRAKRASILVEALEDRALFCALHMAGIGRPAALATQPVHLKPAAEEAPPATAAELNAVAYNGSTGNDNYLVRLKTGGGFLEVLLNNAVIDTQALPVDSMTFNMNNGNDTLTVAASVTTSIIMNGQAGSDTLSLNSTSATVTFNPNSAATSPEDVVDASAGAIQFPSTIDLLSLNLTGSASATLVAGGVHTLYTGALTIGAGAKLDLNDNDLVAAGPSAATVRNWIIAGFGDGAGGIASTAGNATGGAFIHSTIDNANVNLTQWPQNSGHAIAPGAVIAHYEIFGDANIDHQVTGDDYTVIDASLNTTPPVGLAWLSGDMNLDGSVTGDDYTVIDANMSVRSNTPPAVSVTPTAATLSGSVSVSATANDITGVGNVQFLLDGVPLGAPDTTYPFSTTFNTALVANGTHKLSARATDFAGNVATSALQTVKTANTVTDPALVGQWSNVINTGMVAINMTLLSNGKILMWDGEENGGATAKVYDVAANSFVNTPNAFQNLFCSAHVQLADGKILVMGGYPISTQGAKTSELFNPATNTWSALANMAYGRWYGNLTALPDGRAIAISGAQNSLFDYQPIPEVYNPQTNVWTQLTSASRTIPNYPHVFVLPDGRLLVGGNSTEAVPTLILNVATQSWEVLDGTLRQGGSSVMYEPGKVMKAGTGANSDDPGASVATTFVLDMTAPTPAWQQTDSMAFARSHFNTVLLPDGSTLALGGGTLKDGVTLSSAVKIPELWNPATMAWTQMAQHARPRLYHSTALLLPDGRVLHAGGGRNFGTEQANETNIEIYSPPYLFKGPRPTITDAPALLQYNNSAAITTPNANAIQKVSLVRLGSVTHSFNFDQRHIPLNFQHTSSSQLTITTPLNANIAPPGNYMLFIVDGNGVPSVAKIVRFPGPSEDVIPPSTPTNFSATGSDGAASLTWTASTDNFGIDDYAVYRGTTSGFTPGAGNLLGRTPTTAFTDYTSGPGTFFYKIIAKDVAGNTSAPTSAAPATVTPDTTAPTVSVTNPTTNANVSGLVNLTAGASDNAAVAGVQFYIDGSPVGAEDTTAPFSFTWNSSAVTNGSHFVTALARDFSNNPNTSAQVNFNVNNIAPPNLIAAWNFNEGADYTTLDASGHNLNGTVFGAAYVPGKTSTGLLFDGVNDYVIVPDNNLLDLTTAMTLEAWVYPTQSGNWRTVILKEGSNFLSYALYADDGNAPPGGWIHIGSTDHNAQAPTSLPLNQWSHLAATYDGANLKLYVNGTLAATHAATGSITTTNGALRIGGNSIWGEWFNGIIDEVRIYNRALSLSEIQFDMSTPI